ncbi:MAG: hypothetical protein SFX73_08450 [Kofleriaceae bacterium]|nr:hypothetical protein [Kofleriaceae bacterium]
MTLVAGLALALVLIAIIGAAGQERASELIVRQLKGERDPKVITTAAEVLQQRGMHVAAEALRARARSVADKVSGGAPSLLTSPFEHVPAAEWTRFVRAMATEAPGARSFDGSIGMFGTRLAWLAGYGCVGRPRRAPDGRLEAEWIAPTSEARFLANPRLQYRVFVANVKALRPVVEGRYGARGVRIGRRHATTSGLIAVAQRLGTWGLRRWVEAEDERARAPRVWRLFEACNGLF